MFYINCSTPVVNLRDTGIVILCTIEQITRILIELTLVQQSGKCYTCGILGATDFMIIIISAWDHPLLIICLLSLLPNFSVLCVSGFVRKFSYVIDPPRYWMPGFVPLAFGHYSVKALFQRPSPRLVRPAQLHLRSISNVLNLLGLKL